MILVTALLENIDLIELIVLLEYIATTQAE